MTAYEITKTTKNKSTHLFEDADAFEHVHDIVDASLLHIELCAGDVQVDDTIIGSLK